MVLSQAGRKFLPYAEQALKTISSGSDVITKWQQGFAHTVTISASPLVATTYLPRWIHAFQVRHQDVTFEVRVTESPEILGHVLETTSDIGFSRMEALHRNVRTVALYADEVVLIGPGGAPDIAPSVTLEDVLSEFPLFTHNHPEYWDALLVDVRQLVPTVRTMRISQVHVTLRFIMERMGVSFLPLSTVRQGLTMGAFVEIPCLEIQMPVATTYLLQHQRCGKAAMEFADFVMDYMANRRP